MIGWAFILLSLLVAGWTFWAGGKELRLAISSLFVAFAGTTLIYFFSASSWLEDQHAILAVDLIALLVLAWIAFRSKRFWPLPVAALQAVPVLTHAARTVGFSLDSYAVGVAQGAAAYVQLSIIVIAAWLHRRRSMMTD